MLKRSKFPVYQASPQASEILDSDELCFFPSLVHWRKTSPWWGLLAVQVRDAGVEVFLFVFMHRVSDSTGAPLNYLLLFREIPNQFTWDLVLREFRGGLQLNCAPIYLN